MGYNGFEEQEERLEKGFLESLPEVNRRHVRRHLEYMRARGMHPRTLMKHIYCLKEFFDCLGRDADAKKATRKEMEKAMAKLESGRLSTETRRNIRAITKAFYKHLTGEDIHYPMEVAWIKTSQKSSKRMLPEDILSENEVIRMLDAAKNQRDKAIVALLFDSGIRMGELMGLRIKDLQFEGELAHVVVNGKTGMRKIPLMFSVPYLSQYLNANRKRKPGDPLWLDIGSWSKKNKVPDYAAIRKRLQEIGKDAGINKRIYPHLFRHSRATFYANRLTEQQLKAFFGWTGGSAMASTYVHLSGRDLDNSILKAYGISAAVEETKPKLTARECPRCRNKNELDAVYCSSCGAPMEIQNAVRLAGESEKSREALLSSIKDPELLDKIVDLLVSLQ